jgi:hypothetical protein
VDDQQEFSAEEMRGFAAVCPLCDETAYPTWERIVQSDPGAAERWKLALLECMTPGCPNSSYDN